MFARFIIAPLGLLGLLALSGCGPAKLDETKNWTLEPGEGHALDTSAQPKPQTITVEFESSAAPVDVLVFKAADAPGDDGIVEAAADKALGSKRGEKSGSFSAEVPENTPTRVVARGAMKKTDVKLHVTNRK